MKIAIVIPHMFMHKDIYPNVIFAPGYLGIELCKELKRQGIDVTFFSPGYQIENISNINSDLSLFEDALKMRGYGYLELLKEHPLIFTTLARQVQAELISKAYEMANENKFDLVHIYTNEEELALVFAKFCKKPVLFTHHEPFNFSVKYRGIFPKYKNLNWISISKAQQSSFRHSNFIANIYHGIDEKEFEFVENPQGDYFAYFGRIIEPKGVHLAIAAAKEAGVKLKIAGKHYSGHGKDTYWEKKIEPKIDGKQIEYIGFLNTVKQKQDFLGNAKALIIPSIWDEPFGIVMLEAMACGTPIIGLNSGAINEIIKDGENGFLIKKLFVIPVSGAKRKNTGTSLNSASNKLNEEKIVEELAKKIKAIDDIKRLNVRKYFEKNFTLKKMASKHIKLYETFI